jgi:hypothetical protein
MIDDDAAPPGIRRSIADTVGHLQAREKFNSSRLEGQLRLINGDGVFTAQIALTIVEDQLLLFQVKTACYDRLCVLG